MSTNGEPPSSDDTVDWTPQRLARVIPDLRKRWVVRAITSYALGFWLTIQVCDITFQVLELPDSTMQQLVLFGLCGMPVALATGWLIGARRSRTTARNSARNVDEPTAGLSAPILATVLVAACLLGLLLVLQIQ
jgi:hypothetical protein